MAEVSAGLCVQTQLREADGDLAGTPECWSERSQFYRRELEVPSLAAGVTRAAVGLFHA